MTELVKYHNDLNNLSMRAWTAEEMDLFFSILVKIRDHGTKDVILNTQDLKKLTGTDTRNSYWYKMVDGFSGKAISLYFKDTSSKSTEYMNIFSKISFNLNEKILKVRVSENFEYIVNQLTKNFTVYELSEFTSLNSTYSKTMYRILKQWKSVGNQGKEFSIDQFKSLLDIPDSYTANNIQQRVLKPILKEIPEYFENFKIKTIKADTRGTPVIAYRFTWKPQFPGDKKFVYGKFENKNTKSANGKNLNLIAEKAREKRLARLKKSTEDQAI